MKTRPIIISPDSGTKLAGKSVKVEYWDDSDSATIKFVGRESMIIGFSDGTEGIENISTYEYQNQWLEVLPDNKNKTIKKLRSIEPDEKLPTYNLVEKINEIIDRVNEMEAK